MRLLCCHIRVVLLLCEKLHVTTILSKRTEETLGDMSIPHGSPGQVRPPGSTDAKEFNISNSVPLSLIFFEQQGGCRETLLLSFTDESP